jgi:hypothetical protein
VDRFPQLESGGGRPGAVAVIGAYIATWTQ